MVRFRFKSGHEFFRKSLEFGRQPERQPHQNQKNSLINRLGRSRSTRAAFERLSMALRWGGGGVFENTISKHQIRREADASFCASDIGLACAWALGPYWLSSARSCGHCCMVSRCQPWRRSRCATRCHRIYDCSWLFCEPENPGP